MRNGYIATLLAGAGIMSLLARAPSEEGSEELSIITLDEDLDSVEKPPELAVGKYEGEVMEVGVQTSQKGNEFYAIKITIPQENLPANVQDDFPDGATFYWNRQLVVGPDSDRRTKYNLRKMIEAFGLPSNTREIDPATWMNCPVGVVIRHGKFNGETRAEIASLYATEVAAPASTKAVAGRAPKRGRKN